MTSVAATLDKCSTLAQATARRCQAGHGAGEPLRGVRGRLWRCSVVPFIKRYLHNLLTEELHSFPASSPGTRLTVAQAQLSMNHLQCNMCHCSLMMTLTVMRGWGCQERAVTDSVRVMTSEYLCILSLTVWLHYH